MNRICTLLIIVIVAIVSGCESTPGDRQTTTSGADRPSDSTSKDIQSLLSAAANASDSQANDLRVRAAELAAPGIVINDKLEFTGIPKKHELLEKLS